MYTTPDDEQFWTSILSISTRFFFDKARARAVTELTRLAGPVQRLHLASKFEVPEWTQKAYEELTIRSNPLEPWEAKMIGYDDAIRLAQARELFRVYVEMPFPQGSLSRPPSPVYNEFTPSPEPPSRGLESLPVFWAVKKAFGLP